MRRSFEPRRTKQAYQTVPRRLPFPPGKAILAGVPKKNARDRHHNPATGRRNTALGSGQAGPRLPVPILPVGAREARLRHNPGTAIENERESSDLVPGACALPGAATNVRLRIGRTQFHDDAFIPVRLVKADGNFVKRRVTVWPI